MYLRDRIGVGAGRIVQKSLRLLGRNSTALPGYVAERISPGALRRVMRGREYAHRILITGTNGKTSTTLMLKNVLQQAGYTVVNNSSGSNLTRGILTTLLQDNQCGEKVVLLLEVDEANMPHVVDAVSPTQIIVLNLFRDQLDRYGEVTYTQHILVDAIRRARMAELILNADDPWVAQLGKLAGHERVEYFGLDLRDIAVLPHDMAIDLPVSQTGAGFVYGRRFYGHLGHYRATDNSFLRPKPSLSVLSAKTDKKNRMRIILTMYKKQQKVITNLAGIYSLYNIAAVYLTSSMLSIAQPDIAAGIQQTRPAFGRQEKILIDTVEYEFQLIKNPTGFNQVIQSFCQNKKDASPIVFMINDNFADGRDVSWLWDVAIEDIKTAGMCIASGIRAYDMALRLQYAGIECEVIPDLGQAIRYAAEHAPGHRVRVMPTYTALLAIRKKLVLGLEHSA